MAFFMAAAGNRPAALGRAAPRQGIRRWPHQRLALPAGLRPCGAGCGALRATVTNALHKQKRLAATACKAQSKFSITRVSA
jgi:hypothetical protein